MKTKIVAGLIVMAVLLSAVMAGCRSAAEEEVTPTKEETVLTKEEVRMLDISVGELKLNVPTVARWEHMRAEYVSSVRAVAPEGMVIDGYLEKWKDVMLYIGWLDREQVAESEGTSWQGWEAALEAEGMTKEQYVEEIALPLTVFDIEDLQRTGESQLTIQGNEALQIEYTGVKEKQPALAFLVAIFDENDLGLLVTMADEEVWDEHKEIWQKIRDSVQLPK